MLRSLQIRNIAVKRETDIEFGGEVSALTGETGAGKSIIIDSICLLLGSRAPRELIRSGESRASVTALFEKVSEDTLNELRDMGVECPDDTLLLTRSVSLDGRSAARVNGQTVTQAMLREIGSRLINIHGQHDNQKLMQKSTHILMLDAYCENEGLLSEYKALYGKYRGLQKELDELRLDEAEKMRTRDMLAYQINEIDSAKLKRGEEDELESERTRLQNAEKIKKQTDFAYRALYGGEKVSAVMLLERSATAMTQLSGVIPEASELADRLMNMRYEAEDIALTVRGFADDGDGDPGRRLDKIESRLDTIGRLRKKYGADIEGILAFREDAASRLATIDNLDERAEELSDEIAKCEGELRKISDVLSKKRRDGAKRAADAVCAELAFLDMPGVKFIVDVADSHELKADGADNVEFLISANPGEPPVSLAKTASGGELSRIMLALRCVLSANDGVRTMIFDEVDAGISGKTSRKVGVKLREISRDAQILCVTHSAQIASIAHEHLLISKAEVDGRAETTVKILDEEGRICEIARILGGINITEKQKEAAREMIAEYANG